MKALLHLLRRELADQRFSFVVAFALSLLPHLAAPIFAAVLGEDQASIHSALTWALLLGFFFGVPFLLGMRWIRKGFLEERRAFELARPLRAWQLCAGKLAASVLVWLGGLLLLALPVVVFGPNLLEAPKNLELLRRISETGSNAQWELYEHLWIPEADSPARIVFGDRLDLLSLLVLPCLLAAVVFFTLGQSLSLMLARPSWRSLIELFGWTALLALAGVAVDRLEVFGAAPFGSSTPFFLLLAFGLLTFASAWRSWSGGIQLDRAQAAHSKVMAPGLLLVGAGLALSAHALTQPKVDRLSIFSLALPSADGSRWLLAGPQAEGRFAPAFLVDPATRRADYLLPYPALQHLPRLSADGRRVVTWQTTKESGDSLFVSDHSDSEKTLTPIRTARLPFRLDPRSSDLWTELDEGGEVMVSFEPRSGLVARHLPNGQEIARADNEALHAGYVQVLRGQAPRFDVLVFRQTLERSEKNGTLSFEIKHFYFETLEARLEPAETWHYEGQEAPQGLNDKSWWYEALPLLEGGIPFEQLASEPHLVALSGQRGVLPTSTESGDRPPTISWSIFNSEGHTLITFPLPARAFAVGEIRPGLLLVAVPPPDLRHRVGRLEGDPMLNVFCRWQTLLVDATSGEKLRTLDGFVPMKHPLAGRRVWLINQNGEPFDLPSASSNPEPILPWRPALSVRSRARS